MLTRVTEKARQCYAYYEAEQRVARIFAVGPNRWYLWFDDEERYTDPGVSFKKRKLREQELYAQCAKASEAKTEVAA